MSSLRSGLPLLLLALPAAAAHAQMHKVETPEKVTRAVAVYEWTGDMAKPNAARLIPVSLFIDGHFEDGDMYLARPEPFTLQTGDVYEIERAGKDEGTLDVEYARDVVTRRSADDDNPVTVWYGYGRFSPPQVAKVKPLKPSAQVAGIVGSGGDADDTPHFVRRADAEATGPEKPTAGGSGSGSAGTAAPNPAPADDPDRPTLRHRDPKEQEKRKREKPGGSVTGVGDLNADPDRPTLRRGVPPEQQIAAQLTGLPPSLHQTAAVSDAAAHEPHIFAREWESGSERAEVLAAMEALARPRLQNYVVRNQLQAVAAAHTAGGPSFASTPGSGGGSTTAKTTSASSKTPAARRASAKAAASAPSVALTNEDLRGYTLSYGGMPTFVYSVESPVASGGPVYLTLVAQRLPSGELQVALSSITDATHLDRVPWMRPVDVVDPDWSHRGQFLMELRAQSTRQFALYRLVTAEAEQTFVSGVIE